MFYQRWFCLLLAFLCLMGSGFSAEAGKGTLIVSYQTGVAGEKLDRIRFWLVNDKQEKVIYPKGQRFSEGSELKRTVVIENLAAGAYSIEFVVPNTEGWFCETPKRQVTIEENGIAKIDQVICPMYATLIVVANVIPETVKTPQITLRDQKGGAARSAEGKLIARDLLPGKYAIQFHEVSGYITPEPIEVTLGPNEEPLPIVGTYFKQK